MRAGGRFSSWNNEQNGDGLADVIDFLRTHPDARRKVVQFVGLARCFSNQGTRGRAGRASWGGQLPLSVFASPRAGEAHPRFHGTAGARR
jgi:predicted Zn-dependent protease